MLSELYFYTAFTGICLQILMPVLLWIAFRIVFLYSIHRICIFYPRLSLVVNCFQNCIFIQHSQAKARKGLNFSCCELLSELYFYTAFTGIQLIMSCGITLWIAFRIVFLYSIHRKPIIMNITYRVVNCFQNCIFIQHSQEIHL